VHTVRVTLEAVCLSVAVREGRLTNDPFATDCNFSALVALLSHTPCQKRRTAPARSTHAEQGLCNCRAYIDPSNCLSVFYPAAARLCSGFAAESPAARRYRSIAERPAGRRSAAAASQPEQ